MFYLITGANRIIYLSSPLLFAFLFFFPLDSAAIDLNCWEHCRVTSSCPYAICRFRDSAFFLPMVLSCERFQSSMSSQKGKACWNLVGHLFHDGTSVFVFWAHSGFIVWGPKRSWSKSEKL